MHEVFFYILLKQCFFIFYFFYKLGYNMRSIYKLVSYIFAQIGQKKKKKNFISLFTTKL